MTELSNSSYDEFSKKLHQAAQNLYPQIFEKSIKERSKDILQASSHYIFEENSSLWDQNWFFESYITYFLHNQASRLFRVLSQNQNFLRKIESVVDFGCGPGTAHMVFSSLISKNTKWKNIDSSSRALEAAKKLSSHYELKSQFQVGNKIPQPSQRGELLLLSFSLCEGIEEQNIFNFDNVIILEPGQKQPSKNLITLRKKFIEEGFTILAPCVHQDSCPMNLSKRYWCHDSALKPSFLNQYELPFSEHRLSYSYLIASRVFQTESVHNQVRVVGDQQKEKGKTKIAICRNPEAEFLTWLNKSKLCPKISRGDLVYLPQEAEKKGQEIRLDKKWESFF